MIVFPCSMPLRPLVSSLFVALACAVATTLSAQPAIAWLDRPLSTWNRPAASAPAAPSGDEAFARLDRRCGTSAAGSSEPAAVLRAAGWVPFLHLDRAISQDGVEVIGGMAAAGPDCAPAIFNLFVFVGGRFAGTLSPVAMTPNRDGAAGAVRITGADALTVEYARFKPSDFECCPSSRVRVSYRIDRAAAPATLAPTEIRQLR